ncbi:hypothetical protein BT69DRAFT_1234879 [Atractiella rhizophila]|nr:hypothetical protein BT69DRAFT_1234879 [Atractiella rhizophila]
MPSWSSFNFSLHSTQTRLLLTTALVSSLVTLSAVQLYSSFTSSSRAKKSKTQRLPSRAEEEVSDTPKERQRNVAFSEELIREYLSRNISFLGLEGVHKLRASSVVIVGMGGVGANAAISLARSGVGRMKLVDFDLVSLSSLNRHTPSTIDDVGLPKVEVTANWIKRVAPWVKVESVIGVYGKEERLDEQIISGADWVIDCIDNIDTKVKLLSDCHKRGIKVFSAMGAGSKVDPARIQIGDISATSEDPLSRSVRRRLRLEGIVTGIPTIFSTEVPDRAVSLLPLPEEQFQAQNINELSSLDNFRVRILPVLGMLPCIFGNAIAAYIVCNIADWGRAKEWLVVRNRPKVYDKCWGRLKGAEQKLGNSQEGGDPKGVTKEELIYVYEEVFVGRSAVDRTCIPIKPTILRWDVGQPLSWSNLVLLERNEAEKHEKEHYKAGLPLEHVWGVEIVDRVRRRLEEEKRWREGWQRDW